MAEKIEIQKLKEEYPDFFERTPSEIIDLILSDRVSEKIAEIASENGVGNEEQIEGISYRITRVLLGRLPSENLAMTLESGVNLAPSVAKKIAEEANQFISSATAQPKKPVQSVEHVGVVEEKPKKPSNKDAYREQV